jgi:DNA-binding XRE family transcriptional regulator
MDGAMDIDPALPPGIDSTSGFYGGDDMHAAVSRIKNPKITTPDNPAVLDRECERATWWREHIMRSTRPELARILGVSKDTVWNFESGCRHYEEAWSRYRALCAVAHRARFPDDRGEFKWGVG